jgi:Uma2 family endonuclease
MATHPPTAVDSDLDYPTGDGKPMAETDVHRRDMNDLIETLDAHFAADPMVYVSGNLLLFYEEGNRRKHLSPDVMVVRGVPKLPPRLHYLIWREGRGPDFVIGLTSKTTRREDQKKKLALYRDVLRIPEYFLFDPFEDYLKPPFQGHRLVGGQYQAIAPVAGRLPSDILGLHLERAGTELRLYDPASGRRLPTPRERAAEADEARRRADESDEARRRVEAERDRAVAEAERLRRELEELRRRRPEAT